MEFGLVFQTLLTQAAVIAFLFAITFIAVKISVAERNAQAEQQEAYAPISNEQHIF